MEVTHGYVWAIVIGMGVMNYALRLLPIAILSRLELPAPVMRWLSYVPVSVMAALVVSEVARPGGVWTWPTDDPRIVAALASGLVYYVSRSFLGATAAGVGSYLLLRALMY